MTTPQLWVHSAADSTRAFVWWAVHWLLVPLPSWAKVPLYRALFGYDIGRDVTIGCSLMRVGKMRIGDHVKIGHLTRFKDVPELVIGSYCTIGRSNHFTSSPEFRCAESLVERGNNPRVEIGDHCGIAMGHYFDVQDDVVIGRYTTIAGRNSTFFTHQLDVQKAQQSTRPLRIGEYCMIGSNVAVAPGSVIPPMCVVSMGSVVVGSIDRAYSLIGGNPARVLRSIPPDAAYFHRSHGFISSYITPPFDYSE